MFVASDSSEEQDGDDDSDDSADDDSDDGDGGSGGTNDVPVAMDDKSDDEYVPPEQAQAC